MKAFEVYYSTGGKSTSVIVLAEDKDGVERALANKDKDFVDSRWCKINRCYEVPLSNVMVSDLSVTELITLLEGRR